MQINRALMWAQEELKQFENARRDALFLLSEVTHKEKAMLIAFGDEELNDEKWLKFQQFIFERKYHKPVSQILGHQPFWKWDFKVSSEVLTPRADSECLIEAIVNDFTLSDTPYKIADFGTGSGCLLLSALSEFPNAQGFGLDISVKALEMAKQNEEYLKEQGAIFSSSFWIEGSWKTLEAYGSFDIILANPPYIGEAEKEYIDKDVKDYEPHLALFAEKEGFKAYEDLFPLFLKILSPIGRAYVEHGCKQQKELIDLAESCGLRILRRLHDLQGHKRALVLSL